MKIWFKIERELKDLLEVLCEEFELDDLREGSEAWWEWIESTENEEGIQFDISRRAKYECGDYEEPVRIVLSSSKREIRDNEIVNIAKRVGRLLHVSTYIGEINFDENEKVSYIVKEEFKCA